MENDEGLSLTQREWLEHWLRVPLRPPSWVDNAVIKPNHRFTYPNGGFRIGKNCRCVVVLKRNDG